MKRWIPNLLTFTRLILTVVFLYLLRLELMNVTRQQSLEVVAVIFILVCATDFFDGRLARRWQTATKFGSCFDIAVDAIFIIGSCILTARYALLPYWFVLIVVLKLCEFLITSRLLASGRKFFIFDFIGRTAAVMFYLIPFLLVLINKYFTSYSNSLGKFIIYVVTIMVILSTTQRVKSCIQERKKQTDIII